MSIQYAVVHLRIGGDPIYMGVARRNLFYRVMQYLKQR